MTPKDEYEKIKTMSVPDICALLARNEGLDQSTRLYRLVLDEKKIELQNKFNSDLLDRQLKTNKSFLRITIIATISAAILGAIVGGIAQFATPRLFQSQTQKTPQQITQQHIGASNADIAVEQTRGKAPSQPPMKGEKQNKK
ncbi:MAG: hypothetical protein JXA41_03275 [Deltaproteobacteria bacterium]|nr:hypothetical protein [Deltaproteobacteria bacterium]